MSSNRRSFFKATLASGLALIAGRVNARPKPFIQFIEYGWNTKTETIPLTFEVENGGGTVTKEYCVSVYTPEPRLVIRYTDGTQVSFVGTEEIKAGANVLEQAGWGKWFDAVNECVGSER